MAQAIYQAVKKGLMLSGLISQEADRIARSVQQMYQGGQLPNVTNPMRDPSAIFNALNKGLGPASNMATPVGTILTGGVSRLAPTATDPGYDTGIPEWFLGGDSGAWAPPLPMREEPEIRPAPISRLAGRDYLSGGETPQAITPASAFPRPPAPAAAPPSGGMDVGALLQRILAALSTEPANAVPRYNPLADSENYAGATNLPATPIRPSWLTRNLGTVAPPPVLGEMQPRASLRELLGRR